MSSSPLTQATSGAIGTAISTLTTYPLDLVNTRLKVQRQLRQQQKEEQQLEYSSPLSALRHITSTEGVAALYAGVGPDVAKSVVDSFLFFLFYSSLQSRFRRKGEGGALRELALAAAAGACARFVTTPVSNVVARKQTAALLPEGEQERKRDETVLGMIRDMWREGGVRALWAGYEASLVLSLNPGITFFVNRLLEKGVASREQKRTGALGDGEVDEPKIGPAVVFLLAAVSKVVATAATYPFQTAKARLQVSTPERREDTREPEGDDATMQAPEESEGAVKAAVETGKAVVAEVRDLAHDNIFSTVQRIAQNEGTGALYDGLSGELLKAFFSHGITMVAKGVAQKFVVQLYFFIIAALRRLPRGREVLLERSRSLLHDDPKALPRGSPALYDGPKASPREPQALYDSPKEAARALPAPYDNIKESPRALPAMYDNPRESLRALPAPYRNARESPRALPAPYGSPRELPREPPALYDGPRESLRESTTLYRRPQESPKELPALSTVARSEPLSARRRVARRPGSSAESVVINMVNRNQRVVDDM